MEQQIYQLKVTLEGSEPPIWRRIAVPGNLNLRRLHEVLQVAMGWSNAHLYEFKVGGRSFGEPDDDELGKGISAAARTRLATVAREPGARLDYFYDFGDNWRHEILVERSLPAGDDVQVPFCLHGERACPPEDCGGVDAYNELVQAADGDGRTREDSAGTLGDAFHPERFDVAAVNQALRLLASFRR